MALASYRISATAGGAWTIVHDGKSEGQYLSKEAAFEAAVAAASLALREGHEVEVTAPARDSGKGNNLGVADSVT
jgi:hypothetical protein